MFVDPPHRSVILGASRLLGVLSSTGFARALDVVRANPRYSDLTPSQYSLALEWLRSEPELMARLSMVDGADEAGRLLFEEYAIASQWINNAELVYKRADDLPAGAIELAEALEISPNEALDLVRGAHYRVDRERLAAIGKMGEDAVLELLERAGVRCRHVALVSDSYGYDIEAKDPSTGSVRHLEIKTSTNLSRSRFFLSRNELEVSLRDNDWVLVYLQMSESGNMVFLGTVASGWIQRSVPVDQSELVSWESAQFYLDPLSVESGLTVGSIAVDVG